MVARAGFEPATLSLEVLLYLSKISYFTSVFLLVFRQYCSVFSNVVAVKTAVFFGLAESDCQQSIFHSGDSRTMGFACSMLIDIECRGNV